MAITLNAKGTSYPSFSIGKGGVTLYQGTSLPNNANGNAGDFYFYVNGSTSGIYQKQGSLWEPAGSGSGSGNVVGPLVSTDKAIARYNGSTGELIENSGVIIDDSNNITGINSLSIATGSVASPGIIFANSGSTGIYSPGSNQIALSINGTKALALGTNGGVTIGTPTGGNIGSGTLNATGVYVNGSPALITNQAITISGDASGNGSTAITLTLANSGITAGTYNQVVINAKGLATSGTSLNYTLGPVSSTTNAIPTFADTSGTTLQNSSVTIDSNNTVAINKDSNNIKSAKYVLWNTTAGTTQTQLFLDGASTQLVLQNNTTINFKMQLVGRRTGTAGSNLSAIYYGTIVRDGSAATTALLNDVSQDVTITPNTLDWAVSITADTTNGALKVQVTGDAATNILWAATVDTIEITG